jgi:hypothetical protein
MADNAFYREEKKSHLGILIVLMGHLLGTGTIFLFFSFVVWLVSFGIHWLHSIHPFGEEILDVLGKIELYSIYVDTLLCAFVLMAGAVRFCRESIKG